MEHNFSVKYPIMPDMVPKYKVGETVKIVSNQHSRKGVIGKIIAVYPNQSNVFYVLEWESHRLTSIPERMLVKVEENAS